jgi:hypothetical protein
LPVLHLFRTWEVRWQLNGPRLLMEVCWSIKTHIRHHFAAHIWRWTNIIIFLRRKNRGSNSCDFSLFYCHWHLQSPQSWS